MSEKIVELKDGIKAHLIKNDIFKTNLICVMLTTPLKRETVTMNALVPLLLKRGSKNYPTQSEISVKLEEMYGAGYNFGIDKIGDNQAIKFYIESISDEYTLEKEDLLKESIDMILEIIVNPYMKNEKFDDNYFETEKENLKKIIEAKIDNKDFYAFNRCIENMHEHEGFGLYKYGYLEDLDKITNSSISKYYKDLLNKIKIDIYISGNFDENNVENILKENENIKKLLPRKEDYIINNPSTEEAKKVDNTREIQEKMEINQGKLVIGYNVLARGDNMTNIGIVFNSILGDGANSMLFQNVREKAGLAYSARSTFNKLKYNIFIRCGIEIQNYDKAVEIIKEQIENIKNGKFTDNNIQNAKNYIISGIKGIEAEQDTEIVFYIGQEISKRRYTVKEYIESIKSVTRDQIIEFAKSIQMNLIYFLTGNEDIKDNNDEGNE
jgi:predicted Zn-dependent peptidase